MISVEQLTVESLLTTTILETAPFLYYI